MTLPSALTGQRTTQSRLGFRILALPPATLRVVFKV